MVITKSTNQSIGYENNKRKRDSNCSDENSTKIPRREERSTNISTKIIQHANKLNNGIDSTIGISFADVLTSLNQPISQSRTASAPLKATKNQNKAIKFSGSTFKSIPPVDKPTSGISCSFFSSDITSKSKGDKEGDIPASKAYLFDETIPWPIKNPTAETTTKKSERTEDEIVIPAYKAYLFDENVPIKKFEIKPAKYSVHTRIQAATEATAQKRKEDEIVIPASKAYLFDEHIPWPTRNFDAKPSKDTIHPKTQTTTKQSYQGRKKREMATAKSNITKTKNTVNKKDQLGKENIKPETENMSKTKLREIISKQDINIQCKNKHNNQVEKEEALKVVAHANKLKNGIDYTLGINFADVLECLAKTAKNSVKTVNNKKCK